MMGGCELIIEQSNQEFSDVIAQAAGYLLSLSARISGEIPSVGRSDIVVSRPASLRDQLSVKDLQEIYDCSYSKAFRIMSRLPNTFKVGQKRYVIRKDLEGYVRKNGLKLDCGVEPPSRRNRH